MSVFDKEKVKACIIKIDGNIVSEYYQNEKAKKNYIRLIRVPKALLVH